MGHHDRHCYCPRTLCQGVTDRRYECVFAVMHTHTHHTHITPFYVCVWGGVTKNIFFEYPSPYILLLCPPCSIPLHSIYIHVTHTHTYLYFHSLVPCLVYMADRVRRYDASHDDEIDRGGNLDSCSFKCESCYLEADRRRALDRHQLHAHRDAGGGDGGHQEAGGAGANVASPATIQRHRNRRYSAAPDPPPANINGPAGNILHLVFCYIVVYILHIFFT